MKRELVCERVQDIFRDIFDDDSICIRDDLTAEDIEDWDSLEQINLLVAFEAEFKIKFHIEEVNMLKNVGEMVDLVCKKLAE